MDLAYLNELISPVALGLALVVGFLIKYAVKDRRINYFIPIICAIVGVVVVACVDIPTGIFGVVSILQGCISGLAATGLFEAFRNMFNIPRADEVGEIDD